MYKSLPSMAMMMLAALLLVGCAKPEENNSQEGTETNETPGDESQGDQASSPEKAVEMFLTAVYDGDDEKTFSMVTPLAQKKAKEYGIPYSAQASDTASFEITSTEKPSEDGAYVTVMMSDINPDTGNEETIKAVCVVSKSGVGWRIAGIATEPFPGEEPLVFNFEDPVATQKAIAEANARYMASMQQNQQGTPSSAGGNAVSGEGRAMYSGEQQNQQPPRTGNLPPSSRSGSPVGQRPEDSNGAVLR